MKRLISVYNLFLLTCILTYGQTSVPLMKAFPTYGRSGEEIRLFTDRNIYCIGETIYFTSAYSCIEELDLTTWSKVLYIELITWNGTKLAQVKLRLNKPGVSGFIRIPDDMLSGNYYLRAYTKWMRNFSAYDYAYVPVKIINPFKSEIDQGPENLHQVKGSDSGEFYNRIPVRGITCGMKKNLHKPKEIAEADFCLNNSNIADSGRYCVTIVRTGSIDTTFRILRTDTLFFPNKVFGIRYLPEIKGISISGKVVNQATGLPVSLLPVSLSDPKHGACFSVYQTNGKGEFVFSLPVNMTGIRDFFIQAESADSALLNIMIDDGYCDNPVRLPYIEFTVNKDENTVMRDIVINKQISDKFHTRESYKVDRLPEDRDSIPFYGSNRITYLTDLYIELPNIKEFIYEVVYEAYIKNIKGVTKIVNKGKTAFSNYPPLVFMDNIHISNYDQLLKVPLSKIAKVDAIDKGYVVGKTKYNGLLSIYSRNGDIAGIDLTRNSRFFNYDLFTDPNAANNPQVGISDSRIPDRRNLVYWNPDIQLHAGAKTTISFDIPDGKGQYMIVIRSKNEPDVYGSFNFTVN